MKLLNMKLKLVKEKDRNAVYAIINGKYLWISELRMNDFVAAGLVKWEDIIEVNEEINLEGVIS